MRNPNKKLIVSVLVSSLILYTSLNLFLTFYDERWNETGVTTLQPEYNLDSPLESPLMGDDGELAITESADLFFYGFDNETGRTFDGLLIVPNIIHYIRFNQTKFSFIDYVCLRSAYLAQKPDRIYLHTNVKEKHFTGIYWQWIAKSERDLYNRIVIQPLDLPKEIFGQSLSDDWQLFYGSDIARIQILMKYGGIYLDNDVYVVRNLSAYRKYEITMGWGEGEFIGNQVIIAHRRARYLSLWLDCYRKYKPDLWYYNAGERPTVEILYKKPELMHRVKVRLGVGRLMDKLYEFQDWPHWSQNYDTIHLLVNHRDYLDSYFKEYGELNERNIQNYPYIFGKLARLVVPADRLPSPSTTTNGERITLKNTSHPQTTHNVNILKFS